MGPRAFCVYVAELDSLVQCNEFGALPPPEIQFKIVLCSFPWSPVVSVFHFSHWHFAEHVFHLKAEKSHFTSALVHCNWCWPFTTDQCWGPGLPGCHPPTLPSPQGARAYWHPKCGNRIPGPEEKSVPVETGSEPLLTFVFILRNSEHSTCRLKPSVITQNLFPG